MAVSQSIKGNLKQIPAGVQGLLATLVADTAPAELRGTAYGMFNLMTGLALLAASVIAGALRDVIGPQGAFLAGATFTAVAIAGRLALRRNGLAGGAQKPSE
ncbi:MAG: hypothetical protein ABS54_16875 [Hyphomicrobium sp. SCN 65-11]|nr:MAG: hypothetical protein ABS54_16875 [Hyphomicrobium sp. SCN 65-11]